MEKLANALPVLAKDKAKAVELERKSIVELKELLEKQEKLLQNKNLIKSLPDRGKKITLLIEKIRKVLELRNSVDDAADSLNRMQIGDQRDERINCANGYEFVINRNSDVRMKKYPQNFKPNRLTTDKKDKSSKPDSSNVKSSSSDNEKSVQTNVDRKSADSTDKNSQPQTVTQMDEGNETQRRLKNKYDASLEETFSYDKKHAQGTQLISIQEGMNLLKQHHTALQEAEMKRAESMLTASINTNLSTDLSSWRGDRFSRYRDEQGVSHGEENDDNDSDKDSDIIEMKTGDDDDDDYDGVD